MTSLKKVLLLAKTMKLNIDTSNNRKKKTDFKYHLIVINILGRK